jgi:hypothetical protein
MLGAREGVKIYTSQFNESRVKLSGYLEVKK